MSLSDFWLLFSNSNKVVRQENVLSIITASSGSQNGIAAAGRKLSLPTAQRIRGTGAI